MYWNNNISILWGRENLYLFYHSRGLGGVLFSKKHIKNPQTVLQEITFSVEIQENPPLATNTAADLQPASRYQCPHQQPPPAGLQLYPVPVQLQLPRATFEGAAKHHTNGTALHKGLPSQGALSLADVLPTCQPLGCSKHTQEQPGAELCLGHGSAAGAAATLSATVPLPQPQQLAWGVFPCCFGSQQALLEWTHLSVFLVTALGRACSSACWPRRIFSVIFWKLGKLCCDIFGRIV